MRKKELTNTALRTWKFRHPPEVVHKAAVETLEKKGFKINVNDPDAGYIETDFITLRRIRDRVILSLADAGGGFTEVTCRIQREEQSLLSSEWEPTEEVEPELYRDLKPDIEYFIYRTLYEKY